MRLGEEKASAAWRVSSSSAVAASNARRKPWRRPVKTGTGKPRRSQRGPYAAEYQVPGLQPVRHHYARQQVLPLRLQRVELPAMRRAKARQ